MGKTIRIGRFEWDIEKEDHNEKKHGLTFLIAIGAFFDKDRIVKYDEKHSTDEERWICIGMIGQGPVTVRFVHRGNCIRIFGAGYWKKGRNLYEKQNKKKMPHKI